VVDQYLLFVYEADGKVEGAAPMTPEDMQSSMQRVSALEDEMDATETFVFGGALHGPAPLPLSTGAPGSTRSSPMGHSPRPRGTSAASTSSTPIVLMG
jgi:hypothetical protein